MRKTETKSTSPSYGLAVTEHRKLICEIKVLRSENAMIKQLSTSVGFYEVFFKKAIRCKDARIGFERTNNCYAQVVGAPKKNFETFVNSNFLYHGN